MNGNARGWSVVSLAVLSLGSIALAQAPASPANSANQTPPQGYVTVDQYNELKQEVDELKKEVQANEAKAPVAPANAATTQSGAPLPPLPNDEDELKFSPGVNHVVHSLFEPQAEKEYFSPFDIMNPAHIRPNMPMQIGQLDDMGLYMGLQTVGRLQDLQQSNAYYPVKNSSGAIVGTTEYGGLAPNFQTPFANLSFLASIPDKMDVYFETYVASRPHPSTMYGHVGYILLKKLPGPFEDNKFLSDLFDDIDVKAGAFDIDFGDQNYRRSNNAYVQRNPLIGNAIVDPNGEEIGGEVYSTRGPVYWLAGIGSGTTTEYFDRGTEPSFHAKLWAYPLHDLRTSVSFYYADLAQTTAANDESHLFSGSRSGGSFGGVFDNGDAPGQILPQAGRHVTAVQGDVTYLHWPIEIYGNTGLVADGDTNGPAAGSPNEQWVYGELEGVYHISPALYLAGRYSIGAAQDIAGTPSDGYAQRFEIGGGYWFTKNILAKVEYVYEDFSGFSVANGYFSGVYGYENPSFNGVIAEISFGF